ncbi:MAG: cyclic nucleotide-binding domain-containing protein [Planctomycetota bacterium]|nr:MAG: cyclic nucleotide-binding domain-containing protein [Planctomycetota bacterium]
MVSVAETRYLLEQLQFSANFPDQVLHRLAQTAKMVEMHAGTVIFREGSLNETLYLIHTGRIALEMNVPGRGAVRILTLGPGEMLAWSALVGEGRMTATAIAIAESQLIALPAPHMRELCEADHEFGYHVMREMAAALARRLVATRLQLLDLFADSAPGTNHAQ